jgi:hypothetical protein
MFSSAVFMSFHEISTKELMRPDKCMEIYSAVWTQVRANTNNNLNKTRALRVLNTSGGASSYEWYE